MILAIKIHLILISIKKNLLISIFFSNFAAKIVASKWNKYLTTILLRKFALIFLMALGAYIAAQSQTQVRLMSQSELLESAQVLGKIVFEDNKVKIYDTQDQLIAAPDFNENLTIEVNSEESTVTISNGEGEQQTIDVPMGVDDVQANISISMDGDNLVIRGANDGECIRLYSLNGVLLKQSVTSGASTFISVQDLAVGTYILIVKNSFLKILKQ